MTKPITLAATLLLLFSLSVSAQKLKDKNVDFKYIALPTQKLPDDFKTYSVYVYGSGVSQAGQDASRVANSITMDGFKRLSGQGNDFGHLRVNVFAGYVSQNGADFKSQTTKSKDKNGKEISTTTYWYEFQFSTNNSFKIVDPKGEELDGNQIPYYKSMNSRSSSNASELRNSYSSLQSELRASFAREAVSNIVGAVNRSLQFKFDFRKSTDRMELYYVKRYAKAKEFEENLDKAKDILKDLDYTTTSEEARKKLEPVLKFWEEESKVDVSKDEDLDAVFEAANYNLALVSYYLDDLDKAEKHANAVLASEGKDKKASRLLEKIANTRKLMTINGVKTVHYARDLSNAVPPAVVKKFEEEKEKLAEANNQTAGTIRINDQEIKGQMMKEKDAGEVSFGAGGNTKFVVESNGSLKNYDLTSSDISAFTIGDRKFFKMTFVPSAKGKTEAGTHILEELYNSEKIKLYNYIPSGGALAQEKSELAFQKKGEANPVSLLSTPFLLFDKGLAKYFSDCADLQKMCTEGAFKMNAEDLIKAARIYSELCN